MMQYLFYSLFQDPEIKTKQFYSCSVIMELVSFIALGVYIAFGMTKQHCHQVQFQLCGFRYFRNQTPGPGSGKQEGRKNQSVTTYKQPNSSDLRVLSC